MPSVRFKYDPAKVSRLVEGRYPLEPIRLRLIELYRLLRDPVSIFGGGTGSGGTGTGPAAELATRVNVDWVANGPYRVDDSVDGAWVVQTACEVRSISLWRGVPGTSGSTVLDLKRNGSSLYLTTANRPTLTYAQEATPCNLPDAIALAAQDVITVDTLTKETGSPRDWRLSLEAA